MGTPQSLKCQGLPTRQARECLWGETGRGETMSSVRETKVIEKRYKVPVLGRSNRG